MQIYVVTRELQAPTRRFLHVHSGSTFIGAKNISRLGRGYRIHTKMQWHVLVTMSSTIMLNEVGVMSALLTLCLKSHVTAKKDLA